MRLVETTLPGVLIVEPAIFGDERGWFTETFNEPRWLAALAAIGQPAPRRFVQDNHSCSKAGVLRGLHYQMPPHAQGKLVRVVQGEVFDVAVDIRRSSPTFGQWVGAHLSGENKRQLWVPEGFAHGFLVLSDTAEFLYKTTNYYAPEFDRCIVWNDPDIGIRWPGDVQPLLSGKDQAGRSLKTADLYD